MHKISHRWAGLSVFCALALCASAASTTPPPAKKAKKSKKPVARVVKKPPVRKPAPPSAEIPIVAETASVWRGCLESQDMPKLARSLGMEAPRLAALLEDSGSPAGQGGGCVAYVAATGGDAGVASVIFRHTEPGGESRTLTIHKTPDGVVTTPGICDCRESVRRILSLPAEAFGASMERPSLSIPENILWQLDILVPRMMGHVGKTAEPLASEGGPAEAAAPSVESYGVRVVVARYGAEERERLESVEIVEQGSGKRVNGAWWLDRADGPGVIIGMDGVAYERLLWESPVKYLRETRGVGASVTTWRRRVPVKKGSKATVVKTINVPAYHLGVDLMAPKGTDVHAVGDARVSFAGRMGGFGNLIILDHGRGYQTYYAHLSKIGNGIKPGAQVARGDMIGLVGSTGHSTAPHLHFETRRDGRYLNPFDETRQLGFWLLTADEQERLAMQLLSMAPVVAEEDSARH